MSQKSTSLETTSTTDPVLQFKQEQFQAFLDDQGKDMTDPIQNNCKYGFVLPDRCCYNPVIGCDCGAYPAMTYNWITKRWEHIDRY